jgi:hypothetical protein
MARMFPELAESDLNLIESVAEARIYSALKNQLSDKFLVIFQPRWILKTESTSARDGETDFLIAHPEFGFFCLEVKGGGIDFDGTSWSSTGRSGVQHSLKDPIKQAMNAKYAVRQKLTELNRTGSNLLNEVTTGHAVFFPDIDNKIAFVRTDLPEKLIGARSDLGSIENWVTRVLHYWAKEPQKPLGEFGIQIIEQCMAKSIHVNLTVGAQLEQLKIKRVLLTQNQLNILDFISFHRRAAICGGAGTGKTVLAIEKVRRLADEGFKTLLICFNRELSYSLASQFVNYPNVTVTTFHKLCQYYVDGALKISGIDYLQQAKKAFPKGDLFSIQLPIAMSYAMDAVNLRFDAIVCDEGQDFADEFWLPIELALTDLENSPFYIFYDTHQNLYSRALSFPIPDAPFTLRQNCRNSKQIHEIAYSNYSGPEVEIPATEGPPIHYLQGETLLSQSILLHKRICALVTSEKVLPEQIVVLIGDGFTKATRYKYLENLLLPRGIKWNKEIGVRPDSILLETVKRFKGLESEIVFIWGLPPTGDFDFDEVLYVGATRAVSDLTFVVDAVELSRITA